MRRSAAPSQVNPTKRPKFMAPFKFDASKVLVDTTKIDGTIGDPTAVDSKLPERTSNKFFIVPKVPETGKDKEPPSENPVIESEINSNVPQRPKFASPSLVTAKFSPKFISSTAKENVLRECVPSESKDATLSSFTGQEPEKRYLSVVWCKRSNKKHKKWEGDAVLFTCGRSVTLYDMEGKEIAKGSGYKSSELLSLSEDETLPIGGKEVQVMSVLTEEQFKSGTCFSGAGGNSAAATPFVLDKDIKADAVVSKPFTNPLVDNRSQQAEVRSAAQITVTPRHDPHAPGALVMPRPSQSHQFKWNKKNQPVVDVVVDPYLSVHLRPHQREGVLFLYECVMGFRNYIGQGAILADDMGLGKTLQCITLLWTLYKQGPYGAKPVLRRCLVITPGSLVKNWYQEFKKWLGSERLSVYAVSTDKKVAEFLNTTIYPVLIISYEMFVRAYDQIQQLTFDLIVCDEGHRLKNTAIKTTSLIMSLPCTRRVVLSGTPIQNDLQEFFSIVEFCNPGVLGSSTAFRRVFENPIVAARQPGASKEEIELGDERAAELTRITKSFVLRRTQDINNKYLPSKNEIVIFCRPSSLQLLLYHQLLRCQLIRSCLAGRLTGSPHLICIAALKKLCNHPSLIFSKAKQMDSFQKKDNEDSVYQGLSELFYPGFSEDQYSFEDSGKLKVLFSLLEELHHQSPTEKLVLVSNHTKTLDLLQVCCDRSQYKYLRLDGQTPTSKRQEIVQRFNSKYCPEFIFLLSSKAGGVGLNLIGASRLVLYDIDWNPANDLQAMARVWRDGQKKKVYIYRLLTTGTLEEKVYQRQISKQGLSGAVMDVRDKTDVQFSLEDLKDLFSLNTSTDCDTHDLLCCNCGGHKEAMEPPSSDTSVIRHCQLGQPALVKKSRSLGMDELMAWKHLTSSSLQEYPMWYLHKVTELISFLFYCETKGTLL
ncbi:hypothetical protein CHS0354_001785 [Potamilus streckersoni]|uniref:DNA repair and recombination protein RAD54B n=1 Tax=Potamilus streckersoni TaxID=2493646 RepID=A0AAE0S4M0_9BIVA|nr:hypothetical protein CHS0354_001785 [Potamilus streckersoni]